MARALMPVSTCTWVGSSGPNGLKNISYIAAVLHNQSVYMGSPRFMVMRKICSVIVFFKQRLESRPADVVFRDWRAGRARLRGNWEG